MLPDTTQNPEVASSDIFSNFSKIFQGQDEASLENIAAASKLYVTEKVGEDWENIKSHSSIAPTAEGKSTMGEDDSLRDVFLRSLIYEEFAETAKQFPEDSNKLMEDADVVFRVVRAIGTISGARVRQGIVDKEEGKNTKETLTAETLRLLYKYKHPQTSKNILSYLNKIVENGKEISKFLNSAESGKETLMDEVVSEATGITEEPAEKQSRSMADNESLNNAIVGKLAVMSLFGEKVGNLYLKNTFHETVEEISAAKTDPNIEEQLVENLMELIQKTEEETPIRGPQSTYFNQNLSTEDIKRAFMPILLSNSPQPVPSTIL